MVNNEIYKKGTMEKSKIIPTSLTSKGALGMNNFSNHYNYLSFTTVNHFDTWILYNPMKRFVHLSIKDQFLQKEQNDEQNNKQNFEKPTFNKNHNVTGDTILLETEVILNCKNNLSTF